MNANFNQFIGHFPQAVSPESCNKVINYFEEMHQIRRTRDRQQSEGAPSTIKKDFGCNSGGPTALSDEFLSVTSSDPTVLIIGNELFACLESYIAEYSSLEEYHRNNGQIVCYYNKIQKTLQVVGITFGTMSTVLICGQIEFWFIPYI